MPDANIRRCTWSEGIDPLYESYHDTEWGVPVRDDLKHFEFLVLESAQAGLSWWTILRKRENYRRAFADFDPTKVARFDARAVTRLMQDAGIVRNRQKIEAAITNARGFLAVQEEFGSFDAYVWRFVGGAPIVNRWRRAGRRAGDDARVGCAQQGSEAARIQVRRLDDRLRAHAGHRARQRSPAELLRARRQEQRGRASKAAVKAPRRRGS